MIKITVKEYLNQLELLDEKIKHRKKELDELKLLAAGTGSITMDPNKVQTSISGDKLANAVTKYVDLEKDIEKMLSAYVQQKHQIIKDIHMLNNKTYIKILHMHYVEFKSFKTIAKELGYEYYYVCSMHGNALKKIDEVLNNTNNHK